MARDFVFSPGSKYSCINCGRCCSNWSISVDDKTAANLSKYDWSRQYPDMKGVSPVVRRKSAVEGASWYMNFRRDKSCVLRDPKGYCRIHSDLGYDAKPMTCKRFPLSLVTGKRAVYARLSYYCPAVVRGEGQPLGSQRRWLETCLRGKAAHTLPDELYWAEGLRMSNADAAELEQRLLEIVRRGDRPFAERLALGGALTEAAATYVEDRNKNSAAAYMKELAGLDYQPLEEELKKKAESPAKGRLAIGLFLLQDSRPTTAGRLLHFPAIIKYLLHSGDVKSYILGAKSGFRKAGKVTFDPPDEDVRELLERFYEHKIIGKRLYEGDMPVIGMWALFCAAYRIVDLMARVRAASQDRHKTSTEDVQEALGLTDLLVVEHTLLLHMDTTRRMIYSVLSQPGMYKNVLAPI